jgi:ornithine cyclodeaminase/alanine dehydrogenase-like protein (mu-crystallin family)
MRTLLIAAADLHRIVEHVGIDALMDELIARLDRAFAAYDPAVTDTPARSGFVYDEPTRGLLEWMPCHDRDAVVVKMVGYHPESPAVRSLPTILSTVSRYDTTTGHLVAVADATFLTALRTGAASAVATRRLARAGGRTLGLIGAGAQSVTQLHAIGRVMPVERVLIHDIDAAAARSFPGRVAAFADPALVIETATPGRILAESDVLCTGTSIEAGTGPVLPRGPHQPWLHINAVGSDFPGKFEVPRSMLASAFVCVDSMAQARHEGECQQLDDLSAVATIAEICRDPSRAAEQTDRLTVFDSTGWALEDRVAMDLVLEHAAALGLGVEMDLEAVTEDPRHPYEFLAVAAATPRR